MQYTDEFLEAMERESAHAMRLNPLRLQAEECARAYMRGDGVMWEENGKYMLDLGMVNYSLIIDCAVPKENISLSEICTSCNNDLFFSHRKQNGKSGTLGGIICMKE